MQSKTVVISGITGKMGSFVCDKLQSDSTYNILYGLALEKDTYNTYKIHKAIKAKPDILIDFSNSAFSYKIIKYCLKNKIKVISGTTNLTIDQITELENLSVSNKTSFIWSPNFALGASLLQTNFKSLKKYYPQIDIVEAHKKHKLDKPSGTAKVYAAYLDIKVEEVNSLRLHNELATHEVIFSNESEKLIFKHIITSRNAFITGIYIALKQVESEEYIKSVGLNEFSKIV